MPIGLVSFPPPALRIAATLNKKPLGWLGIGQYEVKTLSLLTLHSQFQYDRIVLIVKKRDVSNQVSRPGRSADPKI